MVVLLDGEAALPPEDEQKLWRVFGKRMALVLLSIGLYPVYYSRVTLSTNLRELAQAGTVNGSYSNTLN